MSTPTVTLNDGIKMPLVGLGCWMGFPGGGDACYKMCETAIKIGYRHLDTAAGYGNEESVGKAVRDSGIPRSEFFITTKLNQGDHGRVEEAFNESLQRLDVEYIDLYLMHWPQASKDGKILQPEESPTYVETWQAMEKLLEGGKVKSIGVSNFSIKTLDVLLPQAKIVPAVNQVQLHPCYPQHSLLEYSKEKGIHLTAYAPVGRAHSPFFTDPTIQTVADKYGITTAQVVLSWGVQRGTSVIPKSEREERLKTNFKTITLSQEDFETIDNFHKKPGMHKNMIQSAIFDWDKGTCVGWTYEQLGWHFNKQGEITAP